ncbi:ROK family protein [Companilactobacillus alimentarius]|uniref:N-acetylmannosamine kinase n=1 Tax=Companilactobacillus alimentarius DSM 20249 TaxID=1423720 RepID=A0A2K9HHP6_9LACO|nr:ROK family protein [Companilactobacillus alimentarius]AUI72070.1 N-acetylmannosamine kinase [Companilactobacillus alimentarius DSM 20249]GEO44843.1 N-acetylmannosamine kinase [Companilactobacillus alimentarius]
MSKLIVIDVGGTSIKYGLWDDEIQVLSNKSSLETPNNIEDFYHNFESINNEFKNRKIDGVGISIPGIVDQDTGIIGGSSALPYIHDFPIKQVIQEHLNLRVALENDANCAALAELSIGVAKDLNDILFLVIGTGVGGAVVSNRKIIRGSNLYGGEFGMMMGDGKKQLSLWGTAVHMAERYNSKYGMNLSGKQIIELADSGDFTAKAETQVMYDNLAQAIYNLQFVTDPQAIIVGGGVSRSSIFMKHLIETVNVYLDSLGNIPIYPKIMASKFHNDSNLIGAAYNFYN